MPGTNPPRLTVKQVVQPVQRVASRSDFHAKRRCEAGFQRFGYDIDSVAAWLCECEERELNKHGLDDEFPDRPYYIASFKMRVHGDDNSPYYVKVAMLLPELESGYLLSFHEWT
jgi:hypothetical protein